MFELRMFVPLLDPYLCLGCLVLLCAPMPVLELIVLSPALLLEFVLLLFLFALVTALVLVAVLPVPMIACVLCVLLLMATTLPIV